MSTLPIPTHLKVNGKIIPLAQDRHSLSFSWQIPAGMMQKAYRLVFAYNKTDLEKGKYLFDTQWIYSSQNVGVPVDKLEDMLTDDRLYYWQIMYMSAEGNNASFISAPASFTTTPIFSHTHGLWNPPQHGDKTDLYICKTHLPYLARTV